MSPDLIQELRDGLESATQGMWALAVGKDGELFIIERGASELDDVRISGEFKRDEDAEFLARCSPDNIRTLLDALTAKDTDLAALAAENERLTANRDEWKATHGRVVEGFAEVCESVGVQFDAPEAVAYAINAKISNAEHDKRAAEAEIERLRKALEAGRQLANVAYNIGQLGHATDAGSLRSLREARLTFDGAISAASSLGLQDGAGKL